MTKRVITFKTNAKKQLQYYERGSNYDLAEALAELIDNSLDWGCKHANTELTHDGDKTPVIIVSDDGVGMTEETLEEAMDFGSMADENLARTTAKDDHIGVYGIGMKAAAYGLAESITIVTKHEDGPYCELVIDKETIRTSNKFGGILETGKKSSEKFFKQHVKGNTGTVIYLSGCYHDNMVHNKKYLTEEFGRIYRAFIETGVKITINGQKVKPKDSLRWNDKDTTQYGPFVIPILNRRTIHAPNGLTKDKPEGAKLGEITVRLALLGEETLSKISRTEISENRGVHFLRGKREICANVMGEYLSGCDNYILRGEISYTPDLDEYIRVSSSKNKLNIHLCVQDQIAIEMRKQIKIIEDAINSRSAKERDERIRNFLERFTQRLDRSISKLDIPGTAGPGKQDDNGTLEGIFKDPPEPKDPPEGEKKTGEATKESGGKKKYDPTGKGNKSAKVEIKIMKLGSRAPHMMHSIGPKGQLEIILNKDNPVYNMVSQESRPVQERTITLWVAHAFTIIKSELSEETLDGYSMIDMCMRELMLSDKAV